MALGAKVKGITVKIGADTTDVGAALASAKTQASALGKELAGVNRGLKFSPASADLLAQRHHVLSKRVEEASRKLVALKSAEEKVEELFRKGKIDQSEYLAFKGDVATAESQLRTFARQLSDTAEQIARIDTNSATAGDKIVELAGRSDAMMAFGKGASAITAGLAAVGQQSVKYALELESAFAGVRKTVDATEAEYAELRAAATGMSEQKVVSAAQVADIMALGGQLGIATGELEGFASTVADLDVSTDLGAEQAATEMAQFANITGMAQGDLGRLASTLVDLGNSSATTESRIMGMGMRIAGAGSQVGLSEQQVLALSAALSSVGIEAEAGGSAVSATLSRIDTDVATNADSLATWAGLAGVSVGEFSALWRRDALGAFQAVMAGMSGAKAEGENLGVILDGLGVTGLRQTDMLKRLSGASDLLGRSVSTANRAWDENTALSKEAAARYATTESQGAMLLNRLKNIAAEMGGPMLGAINGLVKDAGPFLDALTGMAEGYAGLSDGARAAVNMFVLSAAAIGPVNMAMGKLMPLTAKVVTGYRTISDAMRANAAARAALDVANKGGIVTAGASTAATAAATAATGANTAATAANSAGAKLAAVSTNVLTFAVKALSLAWATNPVAVVTVALAALAGVVALVATKTSGLGDEYAGLTQASRAQGRAVDDLRARYEAFTDEERATSEEAGRVAAELDEAEAAFERNRRTVEELTEEIREAREGYLEWSDGLADAEADANAQRGALSALADAYAELSGREGLSAEGQGRLRVASRQLADELPGLAEGYDEVSGSLGVADADLRRLIDDQFRAVQQSVRLGALKEAYRGLSDAEGKAKAAQDEYDAALGAHGAQADMAAAMTMEGAWAYQAYSGELAAAEERLAEANGTVEAYRAQIERTTEEVGLWAARTEGAKALLADLGEQQSYTTAQLEEYGTTIDDVNAALGERAAAALDEHKARLEENREGVEALVEENGWLQGSLDGVGMSTEELAEALTGAGLTVDDLRTQMSQFFDVSDAGFKKLDSASQTTAGEFLTNLRDWTAASQEFGSNISALYARAGSDSEREFVLYLNSLGEKGAQIARDLVNDSGGLLTELSTAYAEGGESATTGFVEQMDGMEGGAEEAVEGVVRAVEEKADLTDAGTRAAKSFGKATVAQMRAENAAILSEARGTGDDIASGVASGIEGGSWRVTGAMRSLAGAALAAARSEIDAHSPSRKMARLVGLPMSEGIAAGVRQGEGDVTGALRDVAAGVARAGRDLLAARGGTGRGAAAQEPAPAASQAAQAPVYNVSIDGAALAGDDRLRAAFLSFMGEVRRIRRMTPQGQGA